MADPIPFDALEALARAIFALLTPITGERATGEVTVSAPGMGPGLAVLPRNSYMRPVVDGQLREDLLYKTTEPWELTLGTSEPGVPITSNVGGRRHNLKAGTVLRFDPVPAGYSRDVTLDADMTGGSDSGALLKSLAFFEDIDSANPEADIFKAKLTAPALMLTWLRSDPADGVNAGMSRGQSRRARGVVTMKEVFSAFIITARLTSDPARRKEGLLIAQAVSRLLSDRMQNDDGEQLSTAGSGVEITGRSRYRRDEKTYIYTVGLRVNQTLEGTGSQSLDAGPWDRTRTRGAVPGREAPEPTEDLVTVDATDDMP